MPGKCAIVGATCPQTSDPAAKRFCPAWWTTDWVDENERIVSRSGCGFAQMPAYLQSAAKEARGAAVSAQQARDQTNATGRAIALTLFAARTEGALDETPGLFTVAGGEPARLCGTSPLDVSANRKCE